MDRRPDRASGFRSGASGCLPRSSKIRPPLTVYRRGICEWNDDKQEFEQVDDYEPDQPLFPFGHPVVRRDRDDDAPEYVYFGDPFPLVRVRATVGRFLELETGTRVHCRKDRPGGAA